MRTNIGGNVTAPMDGSITCSGALWFFLVYTTSARKIVHHADIGGHTKTRASLMLELYGFSLQTPKELGKLHMKRTAVGEM